METETFRERLISGAFGVGWKLVCRLPESLTRALFNFGADVAWRRQGAGVQVLEGNLVRVLRTTAASSPADDDIDGVYRPGERSSATPEGQPESGPEGQPESGPTAKTAIASGPPEVDQEELRALSRAVMRSYARYYLETFRLQIIPDERIRAGMHANMENIDLTLEHMKNGRGVIYALPHMGDFEQAGRWVILIGAGSFTTVAERLKPDSVFQKFLAFRQSLGMEVLPTTGGPHPFGVLAQRLRAGKLICIVADRDLSDTGVEVDFFGEKALMPAGPAALAIQTGAALMPVAC
jgi:lauroyl/myristoyl acyltransferase